MSDETNTSEDLVARLRDHGQHDREEMNHTWRRFRRERLEAADAIDALRAEVERLTAERDKWSTRAMDELGENLETKAHQQRAIGEFSSETIEAIRELANHAEAHGIRIAFADGYTPRGERQECGIAGVAFEWVDQRPGGSPSGDDFHGTVTWKMGNYYVIADF